MRLIPIRAFAAVVAATIVAAFAISVSLAAPASGAARVAAPAASPLGIWKITYGAPSTVKISSTGSHAYTMAAHSPVTVVGSHCRLPVGTTIATFSGTGTAYRGKHGLWDTTSCAFVSWTSLRLTVHGDTAVQTLGNGESRTMTRVAAGAQSAGAFSWWWLWLLVALVILALLVVLLVRRRERRAPTRSR